MKTSQSRRILLVLIILVVFLLIIVFEEKPSPESYFPGHDKWVTLPKDTMREFIAFTVSFDGADDNDGDGIADTYRVPEWVAYMVKRSADNNNKAPKRPKWFTDPVLFEAGLAASDESYRFSAKQRQANPDNPMYHYERGHMCRKSTAFRLGAQADRETHTFLNACPQLDDLNKGAWKELEDKVEHWADYYDSVWVVCGPIFYNKTPDMWLGEKGELKVAIPDAFFKIVVRQTANREYPDVLAFIFPQIPEKEMNTRNMRLLDFVVTVDSIETVTGLNFLSILPDREEQSVESTAAMNLW